MINGIYYKYIYLVVVALCTFIHILNLKKYRGNLVESHLSGIFLLIFLVLFIGLRPYMDVLTDTIGISIYYKANLLYPFKFNPLAENLIFDNVLLWFSSLGINFSAFLVLVAAVYYGMRYLSCKKMFPKHSYTAFLIFLAAFLSYSSATNGFKAGMAASVFCCAIAYRKRKLLAACLLLISWGIHHAMHVCVIAYLIVSLCKNTRVYYIIWIFSALIAIAHIDYFQVLFAGVTDEKGSQYLLAEDGAWMTGLRLDFMLYSFMPVALGWYITEKLKIQDRGFQFVLTLYMLLNSVWMLCMYANYTNRIAALSWFLYPMVIAYPFLSPSFEGIYKNNKLLIKIILCHLFFTLFMDLVYYTILR